MNPNSSSSSSGGSASGGGASGGGASGGGASGGGASGGGASGGGGLHSSSYTGGSTAKNPLGRPSNTRFYVTVPPCAQPGHYFAVIVNGQQMMVQCPLDKEPGDRLLLHAPRKQHQQFVVIVPENISAGQSFRATINNQEVKVTVPANVVSGARIAFDIPVIANEKNSSSSSSSASSAILNNSKAIGPAYQIFEAIIPDNSRPGEHFPVAIGDNHVLVMRPDDSVPGQLLRFVVPSNSTQQLVDTFRLKYESDRAGWSRFLGRDLKYYWVYCKPASDTAVDPQYKYGAENRGFVRTFDPPLRSNVRYDHCRVNLIPADRLSIQATVEHATINHIEIGRLSKMPFQQKTEWLKNQFASLRTPWDNGHVRIKVGRATILEDAMVQFVQLPIADAHKIFRFEFLGEPALDAGGVTREFYSLLVDQICNPDVGLFSYSSTNQSQVQINPNSEIANEHHLRYFFMLGRVQGKALMDNQITAVHYVQPIYKMITGWPVVLKDIEQIDVDLYRNFSNLIDFEDVSQLCLDFSVTEDHLGVTSNFELIPGGASIEVDNDSLSEYLDAQLKYRLLTRIAPQLNAFLRGFYDIVPEEFLSIFNYQEMELLFHGLPIIDMDDWRKNTDYAGEFARNSHHSVVTWFWDIIRGYKNENRAKLLQFVTGTSGVPAQGFAYLQGNDGNIRKFTINGDRNVKVFPRAHTCFNRIDLPLYKTKQEMQKFLTLAITMEATGFDIE